MSAPSAPDFRKSAIRLVAAGLGAVAAGPLGAALGGSLGSLFGDEAAKAIEPYLNSGAEKLSEFGVHFCFDKFREMQRHPPLEKVAAEALRRALEHVGGTLDAADHESYGDWFENWSWILEQGLSDLDILPKLVRTSSALQQEQALEDLFRSAMERLDGVARARGRQDAGSISITAPDSFRSMPDELFFLLLNRVPQPLRSNFDGLVALPEHRSAWILSSRVFTPMCARGFLRSTPS